VAPLLRLSCVLGRVDFSLFLLIGSSFFFVSGFWCSEECFLALVLVPCAFFCCFLSFGRARGFQLVPDLALILLTSFSLFGLVLAGFFLDWIPTGGLRQGNEGLFTYTFAITSFSSSQFDWLVSTSAPTTPLLLLLGCL